jgi:hypothetical protein
VLITRYKPFILRKEIVEATEPVARSRATAVDRRLQ